MIRRRTRARELAIQFLYQIDLRKVEMQSSEALEGLDDFLAMETKDHEARNFARGLIEGTRNASQQIDDLVRQVARNWDLDRMAVLDRNIMRLAIYEMLYCSDIPPKVSINEAIELGKRFSTANSGGFINGILDRVRIDHIEKDGGPTPYAAPLIAPPSHDELMTPSEETPERPAAELAEPELSEPAPSAPKLARPKKKLPKNPLPKLNPWGEDD